MVSAQSLDASSNNPYIVEDEFHVVWDFDKEAEGETHVSHTATVPSAPSKPGKNLYNFFSFSIESLSENKLLQRFFVL